MNGAAGQTHSNTYTPEISLIVFDLDGVLVDVESSWVWVHEHFGKNNDTAYEEYKRGGIDDQEFMRRDIALWRLEKERLHIDEIREILNRVPLMPGLEETFEVIKKHGIRTAIVSGGLHLLAERVAGLVGIEMILANDLETDGVGYLTGEGILGVALNDKRTPFMRVMDEMKVPKERIMAVGNSYIDAPMLEEAGLGIAFNPMDKVVKEAADIVVRENDLTQILPYLPGDG